MDDYKYLFKVVLIGEAGVGKTCLVRRFCQGTFPVGQAATIGVDFMIKNVEINNEKIKVKFQQLRNYSLLNLINLIILSFKFGIQLAKKDSEQ